MSRSSLTRRSRRSSSGEDMRIVWHGSRQGSRLRAMTMRTLASFVGTLAIGTAIAAAQTSAQPVEYKSPAGVEYRSQADTDAIKTARAALAADPKNIAKMID